VNHGVGALVQLPLPRGVQIRLLLLGQAIRPRVEPVHVHQVNGHHPVCMVCPEPFRNATSHVTAVGHEAIVAEPDHESRPDICNSSDVRSPLMGRAENPYPGSDGITTSKLKPSTCFVSSGTSGRSSVKQLGQPLVRIRGTRAAPVP